MLEGVVERDNLFWVDNVPLNGTNQITDVAGNVMATNITVKESSLALTIDTLPGGEELYRAGGSVSGTVGDRQRLRASTGRMRWWKRRPTGRGATAGARMW